MTYRRAVLEALLKVTEEDAFANLAAKQAFSDVRPNDVGRSTALLYTTLEHLTYCDFIINAYAKGRVRPQIRGVLRLAATELFFMDTPEHAVCNESVKLTAEIGKAQLKGYVNGVLRAIIRDRHEGKLPALPEDPAERLEIETGFPRFIIGEHIARFGLDRAESFFKAKPCPSCIRAVYPNKLTDIETELEAYGVSGSDLLSEDALFVESLAGLAESDLFTDGRVTVQSAGAMLACRCLDPLPGMRVLDCCAAPGGKTAYVFDLMRREGSILAWELHPHRAELIERTLERLHIPFERIAGASEAAALMDTSRDGVSIAVHDATLPVPELEGRFDAVLCDVPCSGLGGGTKPDARSRRTEESVDELSRLQLAILKNCSRFVKPGGTLVYSTCTVSLRENEGVIERFLESEKGFIHSSLSGYLPERLKERGECGSITLLPNVDGVEGFFISRMIRKD